MSPLQTSPEHRAHCVGVFVSEGPGFLLLILAVGLCGCAFVPLSKHDPPTRSAAAARAAAVSVIVVDDDDANVAHGVVEALETSTREGPRRSFGTDGNDADTLTEGDDAKRHEHVAYEKRNETRGDARRERVDVLRLSDVFDVGAFEDGEACGEDGGARRRGETPTGETHLASALADLDLDACLERHPERVSHVFFTSGSTGTPKGCVATRGALAWFAAGKRETHRLDASSVVLVASPHVFDPSLGDVYASLSAGGCVALCPEAKVVSELGACLLATNATHLTATPTALGEPGNGRGVSSRIAPPSAPVNSACCSRDWSRRTHASMVHGGATADNAWLPGGVAFQAGSSTSDAYGSCARMANATPCEGALRFGNEGEPPSSRSPHSSSTFLA